jgi:acyl-CoA thioesterase-2
METQPEPLLELLDLQRDEDGVFRAPAPRAWLPRVFGGQLLAQGLWAASRTFDGSVCHALHAHFLRGGEPEVPIDYHVDPIREGRTLSVCCVSARQSDATKVTMTASFERNGVRGREHQQPMPPTPPPEAYGDEAERVADLLSRAPAEFHGHIKRRWPFEWITVDEFDLREKKPAPAQVRTWIRAREPLPDDPNLHRAALAYASDMVVIDPSLNAIEAEFGRPTLQIASLDHAMWFHRAGRADEWMLFICDSPSVADGRGFNRGVIYDRKGRLLASIAQEALVRDLGPDERDG